MTCADCGGPIGQDAGPPDGWQLEDNRIVCDSCCVTDLQIMASLLASMTHSNPIPNADRI
jgi:hypothetical protein